MTAARIRSSFPNLLRRFGGLSSTAGGGKTCLSLKLPKTLFIPNIKVFNSVIKDSFSGGNNQDIHLPEIALGVACIANLVGDQDDTSENDEDIEGIDKDPGVVVESPEGDESDVNENNLSFLEDKEDLSNHKLEIIGGDKEGSEWLVLDDVYILHKYRTTREEIFWECSGRRAFDCPFKAATDDADSEVIGNKRQKTNVNSSEIVQGKKRRGRPPKNAGIIGRRRQVAGPQLPTQEAPVPDDPGDAPAPPRHVEVHGSNVQIANISKTVPDLPIPPRTGLRPIPSALPSSKTRTTASAVPNTITAEKSLCAINISSSFVSRNALVEHIDKFNLGLRERPPVPADGNCWFWSNVDLIKNLSLLLQ